VELGERARVLALELLEDLADPPARLHARPGLRPGPRLGRSRPSTALGAP
jgi:hypothetical protein